MNAETSRYKARVDGRNFSNQNIDKTTHMGVLNQLSTMFYLDQMCIKRYLTIRVNFQKVVRLAPQLFQSHIKQ